MEIALDNFTIAKAQAFIDIQDKKSNKEVIDNLLLNLGTSVVKDEDIINLFYSILIENLDRIDLLDYLITQYPSQKQNIDIFKMSLYMVKNIDINDMIKEYYTNYGEDNDILGLELNYLVTHNFMNPERIRYILDHIKKKDNK